MIDVKKETEKEEGARQECDGDNNTGSQDIDLEKILDDLKKEASNAALALEYQKTVQVESSKAFADLEKALSEFVKIIEDYQKVREKLKQEISNHTDYRRHQEVMIDARVDEPVRNKTIEEINNFYSAVKKLPEEVENAKIALKTAEEELEKKEREQKSKITAFEKSKTKQKISEDAIKYLTDLQNSIEKNETENKFAVMFYLIKYKFKDKLESIPTIINDNSIFKKELENAWHEMNEANINVRESRSALATAEKRLEVAEEANKNREQELEARLIKKLAGFKIDSTATS